MKLNYLSLKKYKIRITFEILRMKCSKNKQRQQQQTKSTTKTVELSPPFSMLCDDDHVR